MVRNIFVNPYRSVRAYVNQVIWRVTSERRIFVIDDLCSGCRLCETFCSSLKDGVFNGTLPRIKVVKLPGDERDIPMVNCGGMCVRPIFDQNTPTCVSFCPTGALMYETHNNAIAMRLDWEAARREHGLFKVIAPWKWPFPWRRPGEKKATSAKGATTNGSKK